MEKYIVYFASLFWLFFIVLAIVAIRAPRMREKEESNRTPLFEEICGGRVGMFNYTWPLVRHAIYNEFVVIKCLSGSYVLRRDDLSIESADGFLSSGIRYKSPNHLYYELRIWTSSKEKVLELLAENA